MGLPISANTDSSSSISAHPESTGTASNAQQLFNFGGNPNVTGTVQALTSNPWIVPALIAAAVALLLFRGRLRA
jgi:hypothetical protein